MEPGTIRFRRFNVLRNDPEMLDRKYVFANVTAAILYSSVKDDKDRYYVQFAYCSPKEKQTHKHFGQIVALRRLASEADNRGAILVEVPHPNVGLTQTIKDLIISEARRKNIRWMKNVQSNQIV